MAEQNVEDIIKELNGVLTDMFREKEPSLREIKKQEVKVERDYKRSKVITAYKLIPEGDMEYFKHDIQTYCSHPEHLSSKLQDKLKNSEVAPVHLLLNSLVTILKGDYAERNRIAKWYAKIYGKDNGWIFINKDHIKNYPKLK